MGEENNEIKATEELDNKVNRLIAEKINLHTCQILEKGGALGYEPFASGVFVKKERTYYILTASHVLTPLVDGSKDLYINATGKQLPILGDIEITEIERSGNLDIGFVRLPEILGFELEKTLCPLDFYKIQIDLESLPRSTQYCVLGYPIENIKVESSRVITGSTYYLLQPAKKETYNKLSIPIDDFLVLNYRGKGMDMVTRENDKTARFHHGMSGGGVWFIYIWNEEDVVNLDYQLIGIFMERRVVKFDVMVGNRLHRLINRLIDTEK